eukprot:g957.t1
MKVLNVAEKPSQCKKLTEILSNNRYSKRPGVSPYNWVFEFTCDLKQRKNCKMIFTSVSGHLLKQEFSQRKHISWTSSNPVSLFGAEIKSLVSPDNNGTQIAATLKKEVRSCSLLIIWTDCDREGEAIGAEIESVCIEVNRNIRVLRAQFSDMSPRSIKQASLNLRQLDRNAIAAVKARSEIDMRLGCAFTRFQTLLMQDKLALQGVVSYGPCQFPTLGFVAERMARIESFQRENFWEIKLVYKGSGIDQAIEGGNENENAAIANNIENNSSQKSYVVHFNWRRRRLFDHTAALSVYELCCESPTATVISSIGRETKKQRPLPLDTKSLQKLGSRYLRMQSDVIMSVAEGLYQKGLTSYPRTETNCFPINFDVREKIAFQTESTVWGEYARVLLDHKFEKPRNGSLDDKAHPPIHPTKYADLDKLSPNEKKVYELITRHYLACCSRDAIGFQTTVTVDIAREEFTTRGLIIRARNYLDIYKYEKWKGKTMPSFEIGAFFQPTSLTLHMGTTSPPDLISEEELLSIMDREGIGTDATCADHIKTICDRHYAERVRRTRFKATRLGKALVESYAAVGFLNMTKPHLRANMEESCNEIAAGTRDKDDVIRDTLSQMCEVYQSVYSKKTALLNTVQGIFFNNNNGDDGNGNIGNQLNHISGGSISSPSFSKCGKCGFQMDLVRRDENNPNFRNSNNSLVRFLRCSHCKETHLLPRHGIFEARDHICPLCSFQVINVVREVAGSEKIHSICPWCFKNPPDIEGFDPGLKGEMRCFMCPASDRCSLASKKNGPVVGTCPNCEGGKLILKAPAPPKSKRGGGGTRSGGGSWKVTCNNYPDCKTTVWLPPGASEVKIAKDQNDNKIRCNCDLSRRFDLKKLAFTFRRSRVPPGCPLRLTACIARRCQDFQNIQEADRDFKGLTSTAAGKRQRESSNVRIEHRDTNYNAERSYQNLRQGVSNPGSINSNVSILNRVKKRKKTGQERHYEALHNLYGVVFLRDLASLREKDLLHAGLDPAGVVQIKLGLDPVWSLLVDLSLEKFWAPMKERLQRDDQEISLSSIMNLVGSRAVNNESLEAVNTAIAKCTQLFGMKTTEVQRLLRALKGLSDDEVAGWIEFYDTKSERSFFYNTYTKKTKWEFSSTSKIPVGKGSSNKITVSNVENNLSSIKQKLLVPQGQPPDGSKCKYHHSSHECSCIQEYISDLQSIDKGVAEHAAWTLYDYPRKSRDNSAMDSTLRFIGAGLGTTGTRSLHNALRHFGVDSFHYRTRNGKTSESLYKNVTYRLETFCKNAGTSVDWAKDLDFRNFAGTIEAISDTPIPMWFWDIRKAYPKAKVILTVRDALEWAERRVSLCGSSSRNNIPICIESPPPILRPCTSKWSDGKVDRYYISIRDFSREQNAKMLTSYENFVRCVVPPENLLVLNVFEDDQDKLWLKLANFLGPTYMSMLPPKGTKNFGK